MSVHGRAADRPLPDGSGRAVAIVAARFNSAIVDGLVDGARRALMACSVPTVEVMWVPGALEVPQLVRAGLATGRYDAVVALGAVIKGDTYHFEVVCDTSAAGLMQISIESEAVVTNGILTVYDEAQAAERSGSDDRNKGYEAALAALETLAERDRIRNLSRSD